MVGVAEALLTADSHLIGEMWIFALYYLFELTIYNLTDTYFEHCIIKWGEKLLQ